MTLPIENVTALMVRQRTELGEVALGFETRNKYEILGEDGGSIGFAAEQGKGLLGMLFRQFVGHWRTFEIHFFDSARQLALVAHHPFRFMFQRIEVRDAAGTPLGAIQQRFAILSRRFDVENAAGHVIMEMAAPFWKMWTFPLTKDGHAAATIRKKWSGGVKEIFTDADNFRVDFENSDLSVTEKTLTAVAAIFVDIAYFERKAR